MQHKNIVKKRVAAREVELLVRKKGGKKLKKIDDPNVTFVRNELESKLGLSVEIINKRNNSG